MMTSSNRNAFRVILALCAGNSPATGEFPSRRPVTRSFDVFFDVCLNTRLSKQPRGRWFETPSHSLWRHCKERILAQWHYMASNTRVTIGLGNGSVPIQSYAFTSINSLRPSDAYMRRWTRPSLIQIMGLSPDRHQAIIWTDAGILLIGPSRTNFSETLIEIHTFSFRKLHLKIS